MTIAKESGLNVSEQLINECANSIFQSNTIIMLQEQHQRLKQLDY
jgi:hypothetical protein